MWRRGGRRTHPVSPWEFEREVMRERLETTSFDVLVIGGGITGAGVLLDAASRGLRAALVEKDDFASGTSSRSSKLVHGGLRYLQQGEVGLVYEALAERQRLLQNAPHLVRLLPFLLPVLSRGGVIPRRLARALGSAMWMYDLTGGWRIGKFHRRIDARTALDLLPTLDPERLVGGYLYYDASADDARLTLTVLKTAVLHYAAVALNGARVVDLAKDASGRIRGVDVFVDGDHLEVEARTVVNATGIWADEVSRLVSQGRSSTIRPAKGIHVTVPGHRVRATIAAVLPVPKDRRSIFVIPWGDHCYLGTTDTDYEGPLDDPTCTPDDVEYVLRAANHSLVADLTPADVVGTWAGLRPLVADAKTARTADLSRRHSISASASGMVTVTGGKLTTYRRMAEETVDRLVDEFGDRIRGPVGRCRTRRMRLYGAEGWEEVMLTDGSHDDLPPLVEKGALKHLAGRYGREAFDLLALIRKDRDLAAPLVEGLPYLRAEAVHAVRHEMARDLDDVLSRRTRARLLDARATAEAAGEVAALLASELSWSASEAGRAAEEFRESVRRELKIAGLAERESSGSGTPVGTAT
ncbi:MAG: glycerol-3-phosphate dehydrogenase [Acidimicrobiales bacterium]|nr:MAG: glycerol-3-phosphate dehydrogenase [Acidimicrobiales bacterium]